MDTAGVDGVKNFVHNTTLSTLGLLYFRLPFDQYVSPAYGIIFALSFVALSTGAATLVISGCTFLCMTTHLTAGLMNVQDMIADIDVEFKRFNLQLIYMPTLCNFFARTVNSNRKFLMI